MVCNLALEPKNPWVLRVANSRAHVRAWPVLRFPFPCEYWVLTLPCVILWFLWLPQTLDDAPPIDPGHPQGVM